jgi:isocitrate/isopropylmalate dehydrogenase
MPTLKRVAVVPGDDAAPEAMAVTMRVLEALRLPIDWVTLAPGVSLDPELADSCDSVLFGSSSGKTEGLAYLRFGWGTYANVRPVKWIPGVPAAISDPEGVDYLIVREALEDVYSGIEGPLASLLDSGIDLATMAQRRGLPCRYPLSEADDGRYAIKVYTRDGVERVARVAANLALQRKAQGFPGRVTIGGKWNVNPQTDGFFRQVARAAIEQVPGVSCNEYLADDLGRRMVMRPHDLDVVLLPNLLGDILSDVGAGTIGGLGIAPSGGYGDGRAYFEPVHGSAPDIAGQNSINPTATMLSAAMMLNHLGMAEAAQRLSDAVASVILEGRALTPDMGGTASTVAFGQAVEARC